MRHRRTQQTSILDYVGSNPVKASTSTQTNREKPINFTATYRGSTQGRTAEGDEAGDEVDSEEEGEGRLDRFRLDHRKTRLGTEELEEPTYEGEASRTRERKRQGKKKVLVDVDSEDDSEDDQPRKRGPQRRKDTVDLPPQSSSQAREAIDAITIDVPSSSSSRSESPHKSTVSPAVRRRRRSGVVLSGTSSSQHASNQEQDEDHDDDDPLRTPTSTQEKPHRVVNSHSASKRKRRLISDDNSDTEDLGRPGPGPSTSTNKMTHSATKRKTRSGGPVTPTPPSPLASDAEGAHVRTRKKARQVDYYESDDPMDLLGGKKGLGKGKGKMREDLDDAVFEAETSLSPSQSQSVGRKMNTAVKSGVGKARQTRSTKRRGISVDMEDVATHPPAGRPTTKLKIFSSESESESEVEPETAVRLRGWSSTPPENSGSDESDQPQKQRRIKGKDLRRKKARVQESDDSEEDAIDPKELLEEIAMDEPVIVKSRMRDRTKKSAFERNLARLKRKQQAKRLGQPYNEESTPDESDEEEDASNGSVDEYGDAGQIVIDGSDEGENVKVIGLDEEEDFINDDSEIDEKYDDRLLPAQFRMSSHQDLEHHFKVISQYFIHLVVTGPTFTEESESSYFKTALEAFRRRFQGMKDSLITSSVWKPEFKKSLEVWPEFIIGHLDEAVTGCDACHLSGRMSKYEGRLEGRAYDPETFEEIDSDDEDDSSDSGLEDEAELPSKGPFRLGKYCQERARVFHEFTHWEHELYFAYRLPYRSLLRQSNAELDDEQELASDEEVKEVKKFVPVAGFTSETIRDGDEVLEYFERKGYIKREWQRMSRLMEDARNLEVRR